MDNSLPMCGHLADIVVILQYNLERDTCYRKSLPWHESSTGPYHSHTGLSGSLDLFESNVPDDQSRTTASYQPMFSLHESYSYKPVRSL